MRKGVLDAALVLLGLVRLGPFAGDPKHRLHSKPAEFQVVN